MPVSHLDITFGIEIECYMPSGMAANTLAQAVSTRIGKPVHNQGYNHITAPFWRTVPDGSLGNYTRGIEVVSPVMRGEDGIAECEKVVRALADLGCSVGKACGLHVHVGTAGAMEQDEVGAVPLRMLKRLALNYALFEGVIDTVMPPSRRANANTYSRSISSASPAAIMRAQDLSALIRCVAGASDSARYRKLNLAAYKKYKTAEFRHHAGTLDSGKVRFWILTCLRIAAAARNGKVARDFTNAPAPAPRRRITTPQPTPTPVPAPTPAPPRAPVNRAREGSLSWQVGQLMLRAEGCTGPEARAVTGWPSISMPQQAAICGLAFTTTRIGRTVRYFARTAAAEAAAQAATPAPETPAVAPIPQTPSAPPTTPLTLLGFIDFIGSDVSEAAYLLQRQNDLSGPIDFIS